MWTEWKWIFKMYNWNRPKSHKLDASYHGINLQKVNCLKFTTLKCVHHTQKRDAILDMLEIITPFDDQ